MSSRLLRALLIPSLLLLPGLVLGCEDGTQNPAGGSNQEVFTPDPSLDDSAVVLKGPYLHAPAEGTLTVNWETAEPASSRVMVAPVGEAEQEVTGIVYRQLPSTTDSLLVGMVPTNYQHQVILTGLQPGHEYTYRVVSAMDEPGGTFRAPPAPGDDFSFVVFGDNRTGDDAHGRVIAGIMDVSDTEGLPSFVINTGDMTMTGGSDSNWTNFFQIEAPLMARVPTLATFGNHDFILGRTSFEAYFRAPPTSTSTSDRYYSADIGDVHITVVDVYTMDFEPHEDWVEADLAATDRPFKIVALHPPLFTNSNHSPHFVARDALVPIFEAYGVQLVVAGHNHCYERFTGYGSYYITTGGGGAPLYGVDDNLEADNGEAQRNEAESAFHFLWATVSGNEMTLKVIAGDDGTAPVDTEIDCFKVIAGEKVTAPIPCL